MEGASWKGSWKGRHGKGSAPVRDQPGKWQCTWTVWPLTTMIWDVEPTLCTMPEPMKAAAPAELTELTPGYRAAAAP